MNVFEAAGMLGLKPESVNTAIRRGKLEVHRLPYGPKGTLDISVQAVETYRAECLGRRGQRSKAAKAESEYMTARHRRVQNEKPDGW